MSSGLNNFVTESEIAEARKKRQEEWEKVRQPEEPEEVPEEPFDGRSLFERLKEQKYKKDLEFDEAHKLKNMIRGLDDDEVDFLAYVNETKANAEKQQEIEEKKALQEFREKVATLQEKSFENKLQSEISIPKTKDVKIASRPSQKTILAGVVRKRKVEPSHSIIEPAVKKNIIENDEKILIPSALKCIGILPGLGSYIKDSSDSDDSSASDDYHDNEVADLVSQKSKKKSHEC